jgi:hypothetical protein
MAAEIMREISLKGSLTGVMISNLAQYENINSSRYLSCMFYEGLSERDPRNRMSIGSASGTG